MIHIIDTATGEKVYIKDIRSIELVFDKIENKEKEFILIKAGQVIASVIKSQLDNKTASKLMSLSEFEIGKNKDGIS